MTHRAFPPVAMTTKRKVVLSLMVVAMIGAGLFGYFCLSLPYRTDQFHTQDTNGAALAFPERFYWGVATAGTQIEKRQNSDWAAFERDVLQNRRFEAGKELGTTTPGHIRNFGNWPENVRDEKSGFEARFPEDIEMASSMGINAMRISFEWARLFPRAGMSEPSPEGVAYYKKVLGEMKRHHITPFVTLFHYVSPLWFFQPDASGRKGWEREDALALWQRYVTAVAENFIPDVEQWCTLNEPMVDLYSGYIDGTYPPLEKRGDIEAAVGVYSGLLRAHAIAYRTLHRVAAERHANANVGITQAVMSFAPLSNWSPLDRVLTRFVDQGWNWDFLDAIQTGRLKIANTNVDVTIEGLAGTEDYVGVNYYTRVYIEGDIQHPSAPTVLLRDPNAAAEPHNDLGWISFPRGFFDALTRAYGKYRKPIYVLENGTADSAENDVARQKFLVSHLRELSLAINQGKVDVRAYLHWSLLDNFEWVEGFDARFGLVAVDYAQDFKRTPRPSAKVYADIIRADAVPSELVKRFAADGLSSGGR
jgi:beta-glucosidase